jgi:hypothetical protein
MGLIRLQSSSLPAGSVLQVVNVSNDTAFSTSNNGEDVFSASITPSSTSNKLFISCSVLWHSSTNGGYLALTDGSNNVIEQPSANGSRSRFHWGSQYGSNDFMVYNSSRETVQLLHSPSTISSFTVKLRAYNAGATTVYVNRNQNNGNRVYDPAGISYLTLMEIAG